MRRLCDSLGVDTARARGGLASGTSAWRWPRRCSSRPTSFLDEPTNHLDIDAIRWLESELSGVT